MYPFSHDKSCCTAILKVFESVRAVITFFSCFALSINALVFFITPLLAMIFLVNCGNCSPPTGPLSTAEWITLWGQHLYFNWPGAQVSAWLQAQCAIYNMPTPPFLD